MTTNTIPVTEADLREQIRDLARYTGWRCHFTWSSIHSPKGFPDLVLASSSRGRIIFAELKAGRGKLTWEQEQWLQALRDCGQEVHVWRPGDIDQIVEILTP